MNTGIQDPLFAGERADWLDRLLRDTPSAPIADDGFSARVMQSLPAELTAAQVQGKLLRNTQQSRRFEWFTLIGAVLGSVIAYWGSSWPGPDEMASTVTALVEFKPVATQVLAPWLATLCSAAVLAYVLNKA